MAGGQRTALPGPSSQCRGLPALGMGPALGELPLVVQDTSTPHIHARDAFVLEARSPHPSWGSGQTLIKQGLGFPWHSDCFHIAPELRRGGILKQDKVV